MFEDRITTLNMETEALPSIPYEKRIYTVDEIQDILGIGRNSAYSLVNLVCFIVSVLAVISVYQKRALMIGSIKK